MAQNITVKPEYVNQVQAFVDGKTVMLNNSLTQDQLLAIYLKQEFRPFFNITYSNVQDSFPENFPIDPSLFNAYDSGQITHNPSAVYPANTLGKALVDTKSKIDGYDGAFVRPFSHPIFQMNFASSRYWNTRIPFTRTGIGSYFDSRGILRYAISNKPRFTHDPTTGESLGLLVEEARTNLLIYSSDFTNSSYSKIRGTVTTTAILNPEGSVAQKFVEDVTTGIRQLGKGSVAVAQGFTYTISVFLKAAERSFCSVQIAGSTAFGGTNPSVTVDLGLGVLSNIANVAYSQIEYIGNGWYRVQLTQTTTAAGNIGININLLSANANTSYTGDGSSGIYIFGAQLEEGLIATSYIPTTDSTVTRGADTAIISGSLYTEIFGDLRSNGATMFISAKKMSRKNTTNFNRYMKFYLDADNEVAFGDSSVTQVRSVMKMGSINYAETLATIAENSYFNAAISFSSTLVKGFANGGKFSENLALPTLPNFSIFQIGGGINTIIKSISVWNRVLGDTVNLLNTSLTAVTGKGFAQIPGNSDLGSAAFVGIATIAQGLTRQEFQLYGTGASVSINVRRNYDFMFAIVDSSGVTSITAQPSADCAADTDNTLTFTAPIGKTLVYAITPKF